MNNHMATSFKIVIISRALAEEIYLNFDKMQVTRIPFNYLLGPVHTNPFSNENGAVLLRFQKDLRPHLSFSYRFRPFTLRRLIRFENAVIPSVGMLI